MTDKSEDFIFFDEFFREGNTCRGVECIVVGDEFNHPAIDATGIVDLFKDGFDGIVERNADTCEEARDRGGVANFDRVRGNALDIVRGSRGGNSSRGCCGRECRLGGRCGFNGASDEHETHESGESE